jgi:hypothetical protein
VVIKGYSPNIVEGFGGVFIALVPEYLGRLAFGGFGRLIT